jgi:hypothetical protein
MCVHDDRVLLSHESYFLTLAHVSAVTGKMTINEIKSRKFETSCGAEHALMPYTARERDRQGERTSASFEDSAAY